jgi:nucleoside-triphosphatase
MMPSVNPTAKNILITGLPGVGKTTLIRQLCVELSALRPAGFYTQEIREGNVRRGFELVTLDGKKGLLSHVGTKGPFRVGKYGVDVVGFEKLLAKIDFFAPATGLAVIDEIGKMECLSAGFRRLVTEILDSDKPLLATIALKSSGFIEEVRLRPDVRPLTITAGNRDKLGSQILDLLRPLIL